MEQHSHSEIIDFVGGTAAVAAVFSIRPPSVTEWRERGIPHGRLVRLAPLLEVMPGTKWTRKSLFPDDWHVIWPELKKSKGAPKMKEGTNV